jgi:ankyrin repeat protein
MLLLLVIATSGVADEPSASSITTPSDPLSTSKLADAAEARDWALVEKLLSQGATVDGAQPDGMTALHWAVYGNHEPTVHRLIDAKCNVRAMTRYRVTPLSIACMLGNAAIVERLLAAGADANATLSGGEMPLMIASRTGTAAAIRHLLKHGAKIDATERRGQTALMWAAAEGNVEAVNVLIEAGADVNAATETGFTAMMFAAREGRIDVVKHLVRAGVDVNAVMHPKRSGERVPRDGTSALILAVESGHFELAMLLVREGAEPNDQRSGFTPLHIMSWVRKPNRGEGTSGDPPPRGSGKLTDLQFVQSLVEAGADVNARLDSGNGGRAVLNPRGATPMLWAAKTADVALMKLLWKLGADPTLTNVDGCTALMAAAGVGVLAVGEEAGTEGEVLEALELLIDLGADVNAVDKNQETAMHGAAYRNYPQAVAFLADHGADAGVWNRKNKYGWTPIMIAEGQRPGSFKPSPETVRALRTAITKIDE